MRILDVFCYSEPYEADLLWIKFNLEDSFVDEWIIIENTFTHQGVFKGLTLKRLLQDDMRFHPFLHKVKAIEADIKPSRSFEDKPLVFDHIAIPMEEAQRAMADSYILEKYDGDDYIFISDLDESLDFTDSRKIHYFLSKIKNKNLVRVPRNRFWYDFDNYWLKVSYTPIVTIKYFKESRKSLSKIRIENQGHGCNWAKRICFEYSYCFDEEGLKRKFSTFFHTGYTQDEIQKGIGCNMRPASKERGDQVSLHLIWWMKKVKLNKRNSPGFIREHFEYLRTRLVPDSYPVNRAIYFPKYFSKNRFFEFLLSLFRNLAWFVYSKYPCYARWFNFLNFQGTVTKKV